MVVVSPVHLYVTRGDKGRFNKKFRSIRVSRDRWIRLCGLRYGLARWMGLRTSSKHTLKLHFTPILFSFAPFLKLYMSVQTPIFTSLTLIICIFCLKMPLRSIFLRPHKAVKNPVNAVFRPIFRLDLLWKIHSRNWEVAGWFVLFFHIKKGKYPTFTYRAW